MLTASSSGTSSGWIGLSGAGAIASAASAMTRPVRLRFTDLAGALHRFARDEHLHSNRGCDRGGGLVPDRGYPDRADELADSLCCHAHLVHRRCEAPALGRAADQAHI